MKGPATPTPRLRCPRCAQSPSRCGCVPGLGPVGRPYGALHVGLATEASELTSTEAHVLQVLARRSTGTWGACWAAVDTLAAAAKVAARTVQRTVARLVELGWLLAEERVGETTIYTVSAAQVWAALASAAAAHPVEDLEVADPSPATEQLELELEPEGGHRSPSVSRETPPGGGVIVDRGWGDRGSPDQITDPILELPPVGSPPDPSPASPPDLPPTPSLREGEASREPRARWTSDRALLELTTAADPWRTLARYDRGERALVQVWRRYIRTGVWPDAPDGLRAREIRAGLADAARRWRAGERLAPAAPRSTQLELGLDDGVRDGAVLLVDEALLEARRPPPPVPVPPPGAPRTAPTPLVGAAALQEARRRRAAGLAGVTP